MPGRLQSNLQQVTAANSRLGQALNMRRRLRGGRRLGDEAATVLAYGVQRRTVEEQRGADDRPLPPLRDRTLRRKARLGRSLLVGVETGDMLSMMELEGNVTVTKDTTALDLGKTEEARDKLDWFVQGDPARNRPARDIVGIDQETERDLDTLAEEAIADASA